MKILNQFIIASMLMILLSACATKKVLNEQEIGKRYPDLASLETRLSEAEAAGIDILSPGSFSQASELLRSARKLAVKGDDKTQVTAKRGLSQLDAAVQNSAKAKDVFEDVLAQRSKALQANSGSLDSKSFREAEKELLKFTSLLENNKNDEAKAGRAELISSYAKLELKAVKSSLLDTAKAEIAKAKKNNVDDSAPKTFKLAEEEYELALNTLNVDRNDVEKASEHAEVAIWNINRARQIAEILKNFETSDYSGEDQVIWYQNQLDKIATPMNLTGLYDQPNKQVVMSLAGGVSELVNTRSSLTQSLSDSKAMIINLERTKEEEALALKAKTEVLSIEKDQQIKALREAQQREKARQQALALKFSEVQKLFDENEAEVYRKIDDVLIRAHGFTFAPGSSEIDSSNFVLLNKIVEAISKFENSHILVSGHTDSSGSDDINMEISSLRAEKVAKFLEQVGRINPYRIEYKGYGETRPVASNETVEGRASNRRVEIMIQNLSALK